MYTDHAGEVSGEATKKPYRDLIERAYPCHIRWSISPLEAALMRLWGNGFQSGAADIAGERSKAGVFDEERGGDHRREAIGKGLASAILLGSFGGQADQLGFSAKDLKMACSRHGLNWNYLGGALLDLEDRCFYLHAATAAALGKRYWFSTKPTLTKLPVQYRQKFAKENSGTEIIEQVRCEIRKLSAQPIRSFFVFKDKKWKPMLWPTPE